MIVPVFNAAPWIPDALRSLQDQTLQDWEAVLIDDGSTDDSLEAIRRFLEDPRFRLSHEPHAGVPHARNRGLALSRGAYLAFLDADDMYLPRKLEIQAEILNRRPEVGGVHCALKHLRADGLHRFCAGPRAKDGLIFRDLLYWLDTMHPNTVMVRRELAEQVGPFDEELFGSEEVDWLIRLSERTAWAYVPEALALYFDRSGSVRSREEAKRGWIACVRKVKERWPRARTMADLQLPLAHLAYGRFLAERGRAAEALAQFNEAKRLDREVGWALRLDLLLDGRVRSVQEFFDRLRAALGWAGAWARERPRGSR